MSDKKNDKKNPNNADKVRPRTTGLGRRDLMKMGVGAVGAGVAMSRLLDAPSALAQEASAGSTKGERAVSRPAGAFAIVGSGYKNDSGRASGNGPMDETSRQLVKYVASFSESDLTSPIVDAFHNTMVDSIASIISGFETEPARVCARLARTMRGDLKSTVLGYGITTTPELAAYANTSMGRHTDYNDHASDMMPGILAIGEAIHATGTQVMIGIVLAYQINQALGATNSLGDSSGWDQGLTVGPATALAVGKLLNLNEDQLANALSLALVPHIPLRVARSGTLSMAKGCATAPAVRDAVFSALIAREGMTGSAQPFEGRDGVWDRVTGPSKELRLPPKGELGVGLTEGIKRYPAESQSHAILEIIPQIRDWTKADDIASIQIEGYPHMMFEIGDPPKWDPLNSETADHSIAYLTARALLDGQIYLDSYTQAKYTEPALRLLMEKITLRMQPDFPRARQRITVRTKSGGELVKEVTSAKPMTHDEIFAKFNRVCNYMHVADAQRDRALAQWSNLRAVKDITEPIQTLAKFGKPLPL